MNHKKYKGLSEFLIHKFSGIRKRYLMIFKQNVIQYELSLRRGECKRCGKCCRDCPCLVEKGCRIHAERGGLSCVWFPLKNNKQWCKDNDCGYWFEK